jgi:hypothetical protein
MRERVMPLAAYPDLGLFVRASRILPIVGIAAFAGGLVGGFVVFAINGALAPPRSDLETNLSTTGRATATAIPAEPATIVGAPTPNPAVAQPPAAVAPPPKSNPSADPRNVCCGDSADSSRGRAAADAMAQCIDAWP